MVTRLENGVNEARGPSIFSSPKYTFSDVKISYSPYFFSRLPPNKIEKGLSLAGAFFYSIPRGLKGQQAGMTHWNRLFFCLLAGIFFHSGCIKVGPDFVRPRSEIASNWMEAEDQRVKTGAAEYRNWWRALNDPVLDRLIDQAYRQNLSLKIAGVRVLEARAQLGIAIGQLYPQTQQAFGSLNYIRTSDRASFFGSLNYWQSEIGLLAGWELDFWGKFRRAIESADASLLATVADYDNALVSLTADVANSYILIRTLEKRLGIARQNAETQQESLRIAQTRFQYGLTSRLDVEQATTLLNNTLASIPVLDTQLRQARNALSVLLGLPPGQLGDALEGPSEIPASPPSVVVGIPADLLRRRPDIRSAEALAAAQSALIGVAKADLFPAFSLNGSLGFLSTDVNNFKLSDMFRWGSRTIQAGPSFQWNLFNYGRITNNVRVQDARFQELLIAYQNTVLTAQREVEDALAAFLRAQERAESLTLSAAAARRAFDLAVLQYREGLRDFTTVLTAQQALLNEQDSLAAALGSISGNLVGVYRALGGGWEIREGQELIPPDVREAMAKRTNWGRLLAPPSYNPPASEPPKSPIRLPDW
jgi:NodT family efflux transporter outer membrane factor (OMF) lipoprotein